MTETSDMCVWGMGHDAWDSTHLDFSLQDNVCITRVGETKDSAKLFRGEITDIANFEFGGLSHDPAAAQ